MANTRAATRSAARPTRSAQPAKPTRATRSKRKIEEVDEESDDNGNVEVAKSRSTRPLKKTKTAKNERRECDICAEDFNFIPRNFPDVSTCQHDRTVCTTCYTQQFRTSIEAKPADGWTTCTCPSCAQQINPREAKGLVIKKVSGELDKAIKQAKARTAHNFLWCPAPGCGHGQQHKLTASPFVNCAKCKAKICFNHQMLWHEGLTCQQYDDTRTLDENARKDLLEIRRTTKPCPFCKLRIKKEGGCNHMTCTNCRKHWQWNTVPFDGETQGTGAEVAGGHEVVPGLVGEARENVNLVIEALNRRVDGVVQAIRAPPIPVALPQLQGLGVDFTRRIMANLTNLVNLTVAFQPFRVAPREVAPTPQAPPTLRTRTPARPTRRSSRMHALSEGRLTVDLTQRDEPDDLGTEIIDLTHVD